MDRTVEQAVSLFVAVATFYTDKAEEVIDPCPAISRTTAMKLSDSARAVQVSGQYQGSIGAVSTLERLDLHSTLEARIGGGTSFLNLMAEIAGPTNYAPIYAIVLRDKDGFPYSMCTPEVSYVCPAISRTYD